MSGAAVTPSEDSWILCTDCEKLHTDFYTDLPTRHGPPHGPPHAIASQVTFPKIANEPAFYLPPHVSLVFVARKGQLIREKKGYQGQEENADNVEHEK